MWEKLLAYSTKERVAQVRGMISDFEEMLCDRVHEIVQRFLMWAVREVAARGLYDEVFAWSGSFDCFGACLARR
jgi:hypothetical protein